MKNISINNIIKLLLNSCLAFILLTFFGSCEKEVDINGIDLEERKVVVNSIISPDDSYIHVEVSLSQPLLNTKNIGLPSNNDIIKNASVTISDGSIEKNVPFNSISQVYTISTSELPIVSGKTYYLIVNSTYGNITSECTVPEITNDFWDHISYTSERSGDEYYFKVKWRDIPNEENFYHIGGKVKTRYNSGNPYENVIFFDNNAFKNDFNKDGQELSTRSSDYYYPINNDDQPVLSIIISDENYHDYFKTMELYEFDGDPFVEPVPLPNNISGGLGIFAAYQRVNKEF